MKKLMLSLIFLCSQLFVGALQAQDDSFQRQIEEIMKAREELLRSLMDDSFSQDFESRMLEMMKRFSGPGFDLSEFDSPSLGEHEWVATSTHRILKLKVQQVKDRPLDIKIELGKIRIKGDVESVSGKGKNKVLRRMQFERVFSIPDGVDQTNPEFENREGELLIKFKRMSEIDSSLKKAAPKMGKPFETNDERKPVLPNDKDLSI